MVSKIGNEGPETWINGKFIVVKDKKKGHPDAKIWIYTLEPMSLKKLNVPMREVR